MFGGGAHAKLQKQMRTPSGRKVKTEEDRRKEKTMQLKVACNTQGQHKHFNWTSKQMFLRYNVFYLLDLQYIVVRFRVFILHIINIPLVKRKILEIDVLNTPSIYSPGNYLFAIWSVLVWRIISRGRMFVLWTLQKCGEPL